MLLPISITTVGVSLALFGWSAALAPPIELSHGGSVPQAIRHTAQETILYNFHGGNDGANPYATMMVGPGGGFFGTTVNGGPANDGTAFSLKLTRRGYTEGVQYAFHGSDGAHPYGGITRNGAESEVGTTADGGAYGYGVVFQITPSGSGNAEQVLYSFKGGSVDGANPFAGLLVDRKGNLFGTTLNGGTSGDGIVFELSPVRRGYAERILWNFKAGSDGAFPYAGLIVDTSGALYGTTHAGGRYDYGTVFKLTPDGTGYDESILYAFQGGSDGANPYGGLEAGPDGPLYGTTQYGGPSNDGTVFELKPSGSGYAESLNFTFDGRDGFVPNAPVIRTSAHSGASTTAQGGTYGDGVVFQLTPSGTRGGHQETVLHEFAGGSDGAFPYGGLIVDTTGAVYGTTYQGGTYGNGTIYKVTP
jgi:uncharacterized repeat protein (TIGR03803 family)